MRTEVICALTAGFAGLLQATRITEIEPSYATISGLELKAIAAAVLRAAGSSNT